MVHPLNQVIDVSFHLPKNEPRRRTSLDNSSLLMSSLNTDDSFMALLPDDEKAEWEKSSKERRLSLGNKMEAMNTTFLADLDSSSSANKQKVDLDLDWHSSLHSTSNNNHNNNHIHSHSHGGIHKHGVRRKQSTHSKASETIKTSSIKSSSYSSEEEGIAEVDDSSSSSDADSFEDDDDSDCDSFCDASIGEPANRNYLRRDLGASVVWGSDDGSVDGFSLTSSFSDTGNNNNDHHHFPLESPPGKTPQRTWSSGTTRSLPSAPFSRPPLRSTSSSSSLSLLGASPRRPGRRRNITEQLDEEEE
mmetsp:Transcript_4142/g.8556  ORF Transcript_4142/g.8556 Transcript_4142/m.8556 type:complete len:304 (-) Transcript_4142:218-1129(-)